MIISHNRKFIFIHVYKVAGTSIKEKLIPYSESRRKQLPFLLKLRSYFTEYNLFSNEFDPHVKLRDLKQELPNLIFKTYFKFAFVRNPFGWQVSLYNYMVKNKDHKQHNIFNRIRTFEEYLDWRVNYDLKLQKDFLTDYDETLLVDKIGKFETLQTDFNVILDYLNIPFSPLKHLNRSTDESYLSYYNDRSLDLVYRAFKPDFELFGYK